MTALARIRAGFKGALLVCAALGAGASVVMAGELPKNEEGLRELVRVRTAEIASRPDDGQLYMDRAEAYFIFGKFDEAVNDATTALSLDDGLDLAYYVRGLALGRMKRIKAGIADLTVYLERHPDKSLALTKRGVRYLWIDDLKNAEKDLARAVEIDPNNAEAYDDLGVVYAKTGRVDKAVKSFLETIRLDNSYAKAYHNLALSYALSGNYGQALKFSEIDVKMSPQSKSALFLKAEILRSLGRLDEALEASDDAEFLPDGNWSENISVK
ncbi:MAG: tetratricopeptide repeat protein [Rhodospirillales bacterium]|nr:tetratricopeptide repeat protein [Rhodospirillales bacterium]